MKNKLTDLNNLLFEQMERLLDDEVCHDKDSIQAEVQKAGAMGKLANQIVDIGRLQLEAARFAETNGVMKKELPLLLGGAE